MTRGRPAHAWLNPEATAALPIGTPISIETHGRHAPRTVGRIVSRTDTDVQLTTTRGEVAVPTRTIKRARIVSGLYEPGDPVLKRHVPASIWRGGVVRTDGTEVLVEQIDGDFAWIPEDDLEPADARDPALPTLTRGPVPARTA